MNVPDHELLSRIGGGAYGEVWLARNIMGTFRAVKFIQRKSFQSEAPYLRELAGIRIFEPISRTDEGFVDILQLGVGKSDEYFYYVMEVADDLESGQKIDPETYTPKTLGRELARRNRFSVDECIQTGMSLCKSLQLLHANGLVHRDIKPSNIIFVNNVPKFADIGLVARAGTAQSFVGTEGFIAPEGPGSAQADIFSLGKTLYEIASGRDRNDFPSLPSHLAENTDNDSFLELNEVLIRACKQNPAERYKSAREMFEDLALLASGKSLRNLRMLESRLRRIKRNSFIVASIAALVALIAIPNIQKREVQLQSIQRQMGFVSANGGRKLDDGDLLGSLADFTQALALERDKPSRQDFHQTRISTILDLSPRLTQMLFFDAPMNRVRFCNHDDSVVVMGKGTKLHLHDIKSGKELREPWGPPILSNMTTSSDDRTVICASEANWASIWDLAGGPETKIPHPDKVYCVDYSPSGRWIATGSGDGIGRIFDAKTKELVHQLPGHSSIIAGIRFSPNEKYIITTSQDATAKIWDVESGKLLSQPMQSSTWIVSCAFSPDSKRVVTGGFDLRAHLWTVPFGEELPSVMRHTDGVVEVNFSPDGRIIATASFDSTVRLWDAATTMPLGRNSVLRHSGAVHSTTFSHDGRRLATSCADGTVRIWDLTTRETEPDRISGTFDPTGTFVLKIKQQALVLNRFAATNDTPEMEVPFSGSILDLAVAEDGGAIAARIETKDSPTNVIQVWKRGQARPIYTLPFDAQRRFSMMSLLENGRWLSFMDMDQLRIFNCESGAEWQLPDETRNYWREFSPQVIFGPENHRLYIGGDSFLSIFEPLSPKPLFRKRLFDGQVSKLAFTPDHRSLLACISDSHVTPKAAEFIDPETGELLGKRVWHRDGVTDASFRADGRRFISGGEDRAAVIWDTQTAKPVGPEMMHSHQVLATAFSPDGKWVGTTAGDSVLRIWDAETAAPVTPFLFTQQNHRRLQFLPGTRSFVSSGSPTSFYLWRLPDQKRSVDDLIMLSGILNGNLPRPDHPGVEHISKTWKALKEKIPADFEVTTDEIVRWHWRECHAAERANDSTAALFHLKLLEAMLPNDPEVARKLAVMSIAR